MTKNKVIIPKVVRGGVAIPIGNNYYYMKGRKHSNGGIDIGNDPKTGLEVENDEIVHMTPKEVKVFSAVPFINGNSPAQLVLDGVNPNKVFEIQEKFKDKNNIKDDGSKAKYGVNKNTNKLSDEEYISIMEKVVKDNYKQWGFNNEDEALLHALNDNTYDYRGYYNKYPNSRANAETHWTDEFKTVYHPTFSNESRYSGVKSQFNPNGLIGGYWNIDEFIPAEWQRNKQYKNGGKINNNMANIIQVQANGKDRLMFIPSTGRRAERSGAHRTIAAVGTKTDNNNNTSTNKKKLSNAVISDLIGAGANIIGGITSNIINRNMLDSLNEPVKPTPVVASKLKTTVNVNPQLDEIRETSDAIVRDINNNTASSRTALNRIQLGRLSDMINTNKVYSTKENIETELINKDNINRQQVSMRNAEAYDRYLAAKTAFENDIIDKQSENNIGLVSNIVGSIQDIIARNEQRRKESYDRRALAAISPNSVEYMYNLGLIPEDEYNMYMTGINMSKDKKVSRAIKNNLLAKATSPYKLVNNYAAPKVLKPIEY